MKHGDLAIPVEPFVIDSIRYYKTNGVFGYCNRAVAFIELLIRDRQIPAFGTAKTGA
jgi:hypothetical protein